MLSLPNQGQLNKVWRVRHGGSGANENFREARIAQYTRFPYKIEWLPILTVRLTRVGEGKDTVSTSGAVTSSGGAQASVVSLGGSQWVG